MKLTIELVPETCWYINVRSNVTITQWDTIRRKVYKHAKHKCEICGYKSKQHPIECHEMWSYDDKTSTQKLEYLIALCPDCHMVKHIGLAKIKGNYKKAINQFRLINNVSENEAEQYIEQVFQTWFERSKKLWKLDINKLEDYK